MVVINFAKQELPKFKEVKSKDWIMFGEKDDYPDELVTMYNESAKHNAIINGKCIYIYGNGPKMINISGQGLQWMAKVNGFGETLQDLTRKIIADMEIHGGFYLQLVPDRIGRLAEIYHMPFCHMRSDKYNNKFYFKRDGDFTSTKTETFPFDAFDADQFKEPQILFYKEYRTGIKTYPLPSYIGAISWIKADVEVAKHTYNNAQGGFTASKFINFYNGEPDEDAKRDIERRFKLKFTGSGGEKMIIGFNTDPAKRPTIDDLGTSDLTKEDFSRVDTLIESNIFSGHQITTPMLFGVKTTGQLGGTTELQDGYEIFKNTYAKHKQQIVTELLNKLAKLKGIPSVFTLEELEPISAKPAPAMPGIAAPMQRFQSDDVTELFATVGKPRKDYLVMKRKGTKFTSDKDMIESELQQAYTLFAEVGELDAKILQIISKDKRATPEVIAEALGTSATYVQARINILTEQGVLTKPVEKIIGEDTVIERELTQPLSDIKPREIQLPEISIKYSYEWKDEVPPSQRDTAAHPSRDFCKKLMDLDRFYSRSDIERISARLGYSVFDRKGGFWNKGDEISPECRHNWVQNVVVKRRDAQ